jgi:hypothetical protein
VVQYAVRFSNPESCPNRQLVAICVVCIMFKEEEYPDFPFKIRFGASVSFAECNVQEAIHSYDCSEDIV